MEQISSPDVPAFVSYMLVTIVGIFVAFSKVNTLMASSPGRWGFFGTWLVFGAYALVPVLLFWFLDYTNAVHDTSLLGALLIAVGYRQILAGEVKGTALPGQVSKLWSPFEAWANQVRDRIATKSKLHSDRFNEKVRAHLAVSAPRVDGLTELAFATTADRAALEAELKGLGTEPVPSSLTQAVFDKIRIRKRVEACLRAIRTANPDDYGFLLVKRKLIRWYQYHFWLGNAPAKLTQFAGMFGLLLLLCSVVNAFFKPAYYVRYNHWRFVKPTATELDRFRTRKFIAGHLAGLAKEKQEIAEFLNPLIKWLRYRDIDRRLSDDILRLVVESHDRLVDPVTIPVLIDALRTENADIRLRIHQTLQELRKLDYPSNKIDDDLGKWVPTKNESAAEVEKQLQQYLAWWVKAQVP
jgi:hypothetical protein